jgi:hypothetical protein
MYIQNAVGRKWDVGPGTRPTQIQFKKRKETQTQIEAQTPQLEAKTHQLEAQTTQLEAQSTSAGGTNTSVRGTLS